MKSIKFWRTAIQQLSQPEMMKYQEAVQILLRWDVLKKEYFELDILKRILEAEMYIKEARDKRSSSFSWLKTSAVHVSAENISQTLQIDSNINAQEVHLLSSSRTID